MNDKNHLNVLYLKIYINFYISYNILIYLNTFIKYYITIFNYFYDF